MTLTTQSEIEEIISQQDFPIRLEVSEYGYIKLHANDRIGFVYLPNEEDYVRKVCNYLKTGDNPNPVKQLYLVSFPTTKDGLHDLHFEKAFGKGVQVKRISFSVDADTRLSDKWHPSFIEEINRILETYFEGKDEFDEVKFEELVEGIFKDYE